MRRRIAILIIAVMVLTLMHDSMCTSSKGIDTVTVEGFKYNISKDTGAVVVGYT
jgi:hypothetical protein